MSSKTSKANFEKHQSVLKPLMQIIIFLQRSEFTFQRDKFWKNKTKIAPPAQYSMYFPVIDAEVLYILVSIKIHIGNDMDKGHYICDLLDYNTWTWWDYDDSTITQYSGYPMNLYNNLSIYNEPKKGGILLWMDQIGLYQCYILKNTFLNCAPTPFLQGGKYPNRWNILRRE